MIEASFPSIAEWHSTAQRSTTYQKAIVGKRVGASFPGAVGLVASGLGLVLKVPTVCTIR